MPSLALQLARELNLLDTILNLTYTAFTSPHAIPILPVGRDRALYPSSLRNRRIFQLFGDLASLLSSELVRNYIMENVQTFKKWTRLLSLFQGMASMTRLTSAHTEYEDNLWWNYLNAMMMLIKINGCITDGSHANVRMENAKQCTLSVYQYLKIWVRGHDKEIFPNLRDARQKPVSLQQVFFPQLNDNHNNYLISNFTVSSEPVSFHNPLHWLFVSTIMAFSPKYGDQIESWLRESDSAAFDLRMLLISDYCLRSCVLIAQMRIGLWVRNGAHQIQTQLYSYTSHQVRQGTMDKDIAGLQIAMAYLNPPAVLCNILDRFELSWHLSRAHNWKSHPTYDSQRLGSMLDSLFSLLITIFTEFEASSPSTASSFLRKRTIHALFLGPMAFSKLEIKISNDSLDLSSLLHQLADFHPGESVNTSGTYTLKPEYSKEIDPYFIHYTSSEGQTARERLTTLFFNDASVSDAAYCEFPTPKSRSLELFKKALQCFDSELMVQTLFYGACYCFSQNRSRSDAILDEILFLTQIGLSSTHQIVFSAIACTKKFSINSSFGLPFKPKTDSMTFAGLLIAIREDYSRKENPAPKSVGFRLRSSLSLLAQNESFPEAQEQILLDNKSEIPDNSKRKREIAEERKAKILFQMRQNQSAFEENHRDELEHHTDLNLESESSVKPLRFHILEVRVYIAIKL